MRRRRRHKRPQAVFHVENGRVRVVGADSRDLLNVPLDDLRNVVLDTRTIQRVQENMSTGLPQLRYINSTVSPELDIARIELKTFTASIFLSEDRFSHTDAVEWLGKIRRFLRAHGWLPEDEREAGSSPPWDS